jgi:hypothetical protein
VEARRRLTRAVLGTVSVRGTGRRSFGSHGSRVGLRAMGIDV